MSTTAKPKTVSNTSAHYVYQGELDSVTITVFPDREDTIVYYSSGGSGFWENRTASRNRAKILLSKGYKLVK